ncbi:uncharacterized protein LOC108736738 isoform X2 [Agrilus planipennis]|uniref:Uncharacterized protein LOC108736738 isoform X2 n=1 Tax=Agrilus planipennis TaxID=224129 RepID=A0A7F5R4Q6_AGRPL|nr:uncharacterized protein LOC108736738 isoform X2 [Agrilus planipennis]XP_025830898.1 uncharacterized protein LOC108736738 isoform X2 [Agrilus planipennis]
MGSRDRLTCYSSGDWKKQNDSAVVASGCLLSNHNRQRQKKRITIRSNKSRKCQPRYRQRKDCYCTSRPVPTRINFNVNKAQHYHTSDNCPFPDQDEDESFMFQPIEKISLYNTTMLQKARELLDYEPSTLFLRKLKAEACKAVLRETEDTQRDCSKYTRARQAYEQYVDLRNKDESLVQPCMCKYPQQNDGSDTDSKKNDANIQTLCAEVERKCAATETNNRCCPKCCKCQKDKSTSADFCRIEEPKPADICRMEEPKPADICRMEEPKPADICRMEEPKPADICRMEEPKPADICRMEEPKPADICRMEEPKPADCDRIEEPKQQEDKPKPKEEKAKPKEDKLKLQKEKPKSRKDKTKPESPVEKEKPKQISKPQATVKKPKPPKSEKKNPVTNKCENFGFSSLPLSPEIRDQQRLKKQPQCEDDIDEWSRYCCSCPHGYQNVKDLQIFRNDCFFETHSVNDFITNMPKHDCVHLINFDEKSEPHYINADPYGYSRCYICNRAMTTVRNQAAKKPVKENVDTYRQSKLSNLSMTKNAPIIIEPTKIQISNKSQKVLAKLPPYCEEAGNFIKTKYRRPVPTNTFALRFQKGVYNN